MQEPGKKLLIDDWPEFTGELSYDKPIARSHTHWLSRDKDIPNPCPLDEVSHGICLGRGKLEDSAAQEHRALIEWLIGGSE